MNIQDYYEAYWSKEASFDPRSSLSPELSEIFAVFIRPGSRCLDVGCGSGAVVGPWMKEHTCRYVGVDVSEGAVTEANNAGYEAQKIEDATKLPFGNNTFDAAVCLEVLEHLFQPQLAVAEIFRVLRPGGVFVATVPNVAYWRRRLELTAFGRWNPLGDNLSVEQPWRDPHIRFFNRGSLERMLEVSGFKSVRISGHLGSFVRDVPWLRKHLPLPEGRVYRAAELRWPSLLAYRLDSVAFKP